jgi:hypothetical protein
VVGATVVAGVVVEVVASVLGGNHRSATRVVAGGPLDAGCATTVPALTVAAAPPPLTLTATVATTTMNATQVAAESKRQR